MANKNKVSISLDDKALNNQIKAAIKRNPEETTKAIKDCMLTLSAESAQRAPIESGDLRNDCKAVLNGVTVFKDQHKTGGQSLASTKVFGTVGYSLPYALRQHEELNYSHSRTDGHKVQTGVNAGKSVNMVAGGEAKFLEKPFNELLPRFIARIKQIPKKVVK